MIQRFEDFRPYLHHFLDDNEVDRDLPADAEADDIRHVLFVDLIPPVSEQRKISELLDEMTAFDVVTEKLERHDTMVATIRDIFEIVLDDYDNMEKYLAPDADIVECPDFERGLAKIQGGGDFTLLRNERKALNRLLDEPQDQPRTVATYSTPNKPKRKRAAEILDEKISKKCGVEIPSRNLVAVCQLNAPGSCRNSPNPTGRPLIGWENSDDAASHLVLVCHTTVTGRNNRNPARRKGVS
ncbi:unnamed protein product [Phytophthora fragariaefolia]|uniref:Unnamed protein product n=1 Tax=Phytophthora fragariaefolia TaxID=1490495 RepID=A0A9W7CTZ3_9STRA|nr:unnamed protein product [Phytophthora fragariaefolia]